MPPKDAIPITVSEILQREIATHGPIPFCQFMTEALYHPTAGYYSSEHARIGRDGDFFTSVSVGALFGKLLAIQFAEMWERLDRPAVFTIVEQGANRGDFARDVLDALRSTAPDCFAATAYTIIEPAAALRGVQGAALAEFGNEKVCWPGSLEALAPFTGVHFSNELIDAFPVHRIVRSGGSWLEQYVDFHDERFVFVNGPISSGALKARLRLLPELPDGYETEVNIAALEWIGCLAPRLTRGFVLAIDYGFAREEYYRRERSSGTLSAYAAHRREPDPLARPGEIDLTAHVDFTSLVERAENVGFHTRGFTDQHHFMVGLGKSYFTDGATSLPELSAFKMLMHPNLMGSSFKVLCLEKGIAGDSPLAGFQFGKDVREALGLG